MGRMDRTDGQDRPDDGTDRHEDRNSLVDVHVMSSYKIVLILISFLSTKELTIGVTQFLRKQVEVGRWLVNCLCLQPK